MKLSPKMFSFFLLLGLTLTIHSEAQARPTSHYSLTNECEEGDEDCGELEVEEEE